MHVLQAPGTSRVAALREPLRHLWMGLMMALVTTLACGAAPEAATAVTTPLPGVGPSIVRLLGALALVLAVVLAAFWFLRNGARWAPKSTAQRRLKVLEVRALGNRQSLFVVGYDSQRLLLGSSPAGMSFLARLPEVSVESALTEDGTDGSTPTFLDSLRHAVGNRM